ncbi:hypothetical protein ACFX5E_15370 [Flavobacterium sp. LS2P90]|uniref:Uncharacterized protein n=1 Tax=Flavobacterium xylosi TaxID=3230415 RepID=A0ABW6HZI2_9FLAO
MKKLFLFIAVILFSGNMIAQDKLYLLFEFMKVDNEQETAYGETESFWEKIHDQRVKNGDIIGWDLWSLQPGGEDQGYQYLTVQVFKDPVKMFQGVADLMAAAKKAYSAMSEQDLINKLNQSAKSRDLAARFYLEQIDLTKGQFDMPLGTVAQINLMKVGMDNYEKYENAELKTFKLDHQKQVDKGNRASWELLRVMCPIGSAAYASHITVDMFNDFNQYFGTPNDTGTVYTAAQQKAFQEGLASRDLKWAYIATLIKKVR